ncbi:MAG: hypothetical protein Ta2B_29650 [Termitinemataceae bacterium]|nr:MAG: hypothetical protein Ta2B_29650 [Termitinemataceae bacterium]
MDTIEPLISVIIPVYNVEAYIVQCLESVINQTYKNLEIIIVDDGSTDKSGAICEEYKGRDKRIILRHTENHGLSCARNEGLAIAKGDLLAFVDSDDWIELDTYAVALQKMQESDADIVMFGFYSAKSNRDKGTSKSHSPSIDVASQHARRNCIAFCRIFSCLNAQENPAQSCVPLVFRGVNKKVYSKKRAKCFMNGDHILTSAEAIDLLSDDEKVQDYVWNKLYKKKVFNKIQFPAGKTYEDLYIMHKVFLNANKIFVIGNCYKYYYRKRRGSIIATKTFENTSCRTDGFLKRYEDLKNNSEINQSDLLNITFSRYVTIFCENPIKSKKLYKESFKKFLGENQAAIDSGVLNKSSRLFLRLPLPIFMFLYNGFTKKIYALLRTTKSMASASRSSNNGCRKLRE